MTIEEAHYNFKQKLNRLDSNDNRDLLIPEIDILLNEAVGIFIKSVAEPRDTKLQNFEDTYRNLEDVRNLVVTSVTLTKVNDNTFESPTDLLFLLDQDAYAMVSNDLCSSSRCEAFLRKHGEDFTTNPYKKSSIQWEILNYTIDSVGIRTHQDTLDTVDSFVVSYIKKPLFCHFASGYVGGTYTALNGEILTGKQDIDLSEHVHDEIVNTAVNLAKIMLGHTATKR